MKLSTRFLAWLFAIAVVPVGSLAGSFTDACANSTAEEMGTCLEVYQREQGWGTNDRGVFTIQRAALNLPGGNNSEEVIAQAEAMRQRAATELASSSQGDQIHGQLLNNAAGLITEIERDQNAIDSLSRVEKAAQAAVDISKQGVTIFGTTLNDDGTVQENQRTLDQATAHRERAEEAFTSNSANLNTLDEIVSNAGAEPLH